MESQTRGDLTLDFGTDCLNSPVFRTDQPSLYEGMAKKNPAFAGILHIVYQFKCKAIKTIIPNCHDVRNSTFVLILPGATQPSKTPSA